MKRSPALLVAGVVGLAASRVWGAIAVFPMSSQPDQTQYTVDFPFLSGGTNNEARIGLVSDPPNDPSDPYPFLKPFTTTVTVVKTGSINAFIPVYGGSTLNLNGGTLGTEVDLHTTSHLVMTDGAIPGELFALEQSTATVTTGTVGGIIARDDSVVTVNGGTIGQAIASENAQLNLRGGTYGGIITAGAASLSIGAVQDKGILQVSGTCVVGVAGMSIGGDAQATESGQLALLGGQVAGFVNAKDDSSIVLGSDITVGRNVLASGTAKVTMTGGVVVGGVGASDFAFVTLTGGVVNGAGVDAGTVSGNGAITTDNVTFNEQLEGFDNGQVQFNSGSVPTMRANGHSILTVSGGVVTQVAEATDDSLFTLNGTGSIGGGLNVYANAFLRIDGGVIGGDVQVLTTSTRSNAVMTAGVIHGRVNVQHTGVFLMSGGLVDHDVDAFDNASVTLAGGGVDNNAAANGHSVVTLTGNIAVAGDIEAFDDAEVDMKGGRVIGAALVYGHGVVIFEGGTIEGLSIHATPQAFALASAVAEPGGSAAALTAYDAGLIRVVGTDLAATLLDPNYQGQFSEYALTGRLADGSSLAGLLMLIENGTGARYELVAAPEPATAGCLALAVLYALGRRRRHPVGS